MTSVFEGLLRGAAAGAAGTTALNAITYLDMAVRGRPASDTPAQVARALTEKLGVTVPGQDRERENRLAALGALSGIATGVAVGGLAGALRAAGLRLPAATGGPLLGAAAMLAADLPMALLGVSDPRRWTAADWLSDAVPHLVYGLATHATLVAGTRADEQPGRARPGTQAPRLLPPILLRAVALGTASGARSTAGVTAVAWTSRPTDQGLAARLAHPAARVLTTVLAAAEMIVDKLPATPSRLGAPGLVPRITLGGTSAAAAARRDGFSAGLPALVGAAGSVGAAALGVRVRAAAARRFGSDLPGATFEDGVAGLLGWRGARRLPG
ncbi:hypothetical protein [Pseudonocardia sp. H11422]|uniref:hypothetical protein n=1 Tax=Pseudonocardia sp. H11422 TaxID=2835866 RepID=UPI001BDD047F|nr:hypothetical protein [Pseudonocardia sp. H11422]